MNSMLLRVVVLVSLAIFAWIPPRNGLCELVAHVCWVLAILILLRFSFQSMGEFMKAEGDDG
jgi:hypothetical protein